MSGIAAAALSALLALGAPLLYGSDADVALTKAYRSPLGRTVIVQIENDRLWLSQPRFLLFRQWLVSPTHSCGGTFRLDWQEEDVCVVHYLDFGRGEYHQHVLCFGARQTAAAGKDTHSLLRGSWRSEDGRFTLRTAQDGVILAEDGVESFYYFERRPSPPSHTVAVEPGAVVLFGLSDLPVWTLTLSPDFALDGDGFYSSGTLTLTKAQLEPSEPVLLARESGEEPVGYTPPPDTAVSVRDAELAALYPNLRVEQTDELWVFPYDGESGTETLFEEPIWADEVRLVNNRLYAVRSGALFSQSLDGSSPVYASNTLGVKPYVYLDMLGANDLYLYCRMKPYMGLEINSATVAVPLYFTTPADIVPESAEAHGAWIPFEDG